MKIVNRDKIIARMQHYQITTSHYVTTIPIALNWNIPFRNLINLDLLLFFLHEDLEPFDWISTFATVFQYIPRLESLHLSSHRGSGFQLAAEVLKVSLVPSKTSKSLTFMYIHWNPDR